MTVRGSMASYVHLLCFSHSHIEPGSSYTPDVMAHRGTMLWKRAMGLRACEFACKYIATHIPSTQCIVDPFCGSGSILSMANLFGLHSIGVDHSRSRCLAASELQVDQLPDFGGADSADVQSFEKDKKELALKRRAERALTGRTQREQQLFEKEQRWKEQQKQSNAEQTNHLSTENEDTQPTATAGACAPVDTLP